MARTWKRANAGQRAIKGDDKWSLTCDRLVIPSKKQMASRMFDFPDPLSPVMALKATSNPLISVLCPYDLKPSMTMDLMCILTALGRSAGTPVAKKCP